MQKNKLRVLVLGGSGFIGPAIVRRLQQAGTALTLLNRGNRALPGTQLLIANRDDSAAMRAAAEQAGEFDAVLDLNCYTQPQAELAWELFSPLARQWLNISTGAVYADITSRTCSEKDALGGSPAAGNYGRNKSAVDEFLLGRSPSPPVTILRPSYIYGRGNSVDRETFIWKRVLRGRPVLLPGDGKAMANFLHVDDLAEATALALAQPTSAHRAFNITHPEPVTLRRLVAVLCETTGRPDAAIPAGAAANGFAVRDYFPFQNIPMLMSVELVMASLGWRPRYDLEAGMRETYAHYSPAELAAAPIQTQAEDAILAKLGDGA